MFFLKDREVISILVDYNLRSLSSTFMFEDMICKFVGPPTVYFDKYSLNCKIPLLDTILTRIADRGR